MVKKIRRAKLPLEMGEELDLFKAHRELKKFFKVKYDPEVTRFQGLYIILNRVSFCVFKNGVVTIMGKLPIKKEEQILNYLWWSFLQNHVSAYRIA